MNSGDQQMCCQRSFWHYVASRVWLIIPSPKLTAPLHAQLPPPACTSSFLISFLTLLPQLPVCTTDCRSRDVMSSIMGASGPLPPLEALADVSIRGATLASGHADPSLPWLAPLGELFSPCSYASTPAGFQPPSTDWSAHLQVKLPPLPPPLPAVSPVPNAAWQCGSALQRLAASDHKAADRVCRNIVLC